MKEHIFEPCIYFDNKIKCVKDIILDHKFDYEYLNHGVNILGDITLSFNVIGKSFFSSKRFNIRLCAASLAE